MDQVAEPTVSENVENIQPVEQDVAQVESSTPEVKPEGTSTPQQVKESWETDKRWGKIFKSHDDTYKSYREMEKMLNPLKENLNKYESTFKEYELDFSKFGDYVKEYRSLRDPEGEFQKRANYIGRWLDNPKYAPAVESYFQDLERKELQELFPGMTQEQIERQIRTEERLNAYEAEKKAQEQEKQVNSYVETIDKGYSKIEKLAKDYGLPLEAGFRQKFLTYCENEGIDPRYVYETFRKEYENEINEAYSKKLESDILAKLEKNKKAGVVPKSSGAKPASSAKPSMKDTLSKAMFGKTYDALE